MVVGYAFFLRKIAAMMESRENLTIMTIAEKLNLRQDEFRDLLIIMEKKGDIEHINEGGARFTGSYTEYSKLHARDGRTHFSGNSSVKSYRLTEKGRMVCER
ncbi:hypothetical protein V7O62_10520 [Methanolobus sp. ZRKC2]|uniref:hypothetical protein n=1 Tax=Methanolobus sp. ZRKC2 TaxID=3125783 RepID=UPI003246D95C